MNPRERKYKILETIVESFVESGEPIGSKKLADALGNSVSSATIRNDMAELVENGYLEQPHTSAGRIPTQRGYRLYVDRLMWKRNIAEETQRMISGKLAAYSLNPERYIEYASALLAEQTGLAAIITTPSDSQARVTSIDVMATGRHTVVIIMMISPAVLKTRLCRLDVEVEAAAVGMLRHCLGKHLLNMKVSELNLGYMEHVERELGDAGRALAPAFSAAADMAGEAQNVQVMLEGLANLIDRDDFPITEAKEVVAFLRRKEDLVKLLHAQGTSRVLIGRESKRAQLSKASVVAARYYCGTDATGWVGVIGPTRLNYAQLIPHIEYFASVVGRAMKEASVI